MIVLRFLSKAYPRWLTVVRVAWVISFSILNTRITAGYTCHMPSRMRQETGEPPLPEVYWVPTIAPSGLIIYSGSMFPKWQDNAFIGGLRSRSLIRIRIEGDQAEEVERFIMKKRIREVEQGPDGAIWVLEDKKGGRLLRLSPQD
jgi:glucose/arabinose dehydrogenase